VSRDIFDLFDEKNSCCFELVLVTVGESQDIVSKVLMIELANDESRDVATYIFIVILAFLDFMNFGIRSIDFKSKFLS
jgi:hypothetical protein